MCSRATRQGVYQRRARACVARQSDRAHSHLPLQACARGVSRQAPRAARGRERAREKERAGERQKERARERRERERAMDGIGACRHWPWRGRWTCRGTARTPRWLMISHTHVLRARACVRGRCADGARARDRARGNQDPEQSAAKGRELCSGEDAFRGRCGRCRGACARHSRIARR